MLQQGGLVGRVVASGSDAVSAAAEGADLVFLEVSAPNICHWVDAEIKDAVAAHVKQHVQHMSDHICWRIAAI